MTKELIELTEEQQAQLPIWRDRWIAIGRDTSPLVEEDVHEAIRLLYLHAQHEVDGQQVPLDPPENIRLFGSPRAIVDHAMTIPELAERGRNWIVSQFVYAQHEASGCAFHTFFRDVGKVSGLEHIAGLEACAKTCGWILPMKNHAWVAAKPSKILTDDEGRTHSEVELAIQFPDGTGVAVLWGQPVPNSWITDSLPTAAQILQWPNMEQRRVACQALGWDAILQELNYELVDAHHDPEIGELVKVTLPMNSEGWDEEEASEELFARFQCGTGRMFAQCVTISEAKTAQEAQNWMHRMPPGVDYAPAFRQ